jgi:hypothetical protein
MCFLQAKPRVVTTKSMPITDDEEDEHKSEDFSGNDAEISKFFNTVEDLLHSLT